MTTRVFSELINARWDERKFVCVGLDSDRDKIPEAAVRDTDEDTLVYFNSAIVDATCDLVCAYKPQIAFYEGLGLGGFSALIRTVSYIHQRAPGVPIIGDMKRGDIGNTNRGYIKAAFEIFNFDAVTVPPYMGKESLKIFLDMKEKSIFVLCRTSNPGAGEFQDLWVYIRDLPEEVREFFAKLWGIKNDGMEMGHARIPLYEYVAYRVANQWNDNNTCSLVVGATCPEELARVRKIVGDDLPILIPGIGAQGGDLEPAVKYGMSERKKDAIFNSSRAIIFGSSGSDFPEVARQKTIELHSKVNSYL